MNIMQVVLQVASSRLNDMQKFYQDILGLPASSHQPGHDFSIQAGKTNITFEVNEENPDAFYHFAFNIPENHIEQAILWLQQRDIELLTAEGNPKIHFGGVWNAHSCYFYDPAGNIVEFIARHNLTNASDRPFKGNKQKSFLAQDAPYQIQQVGCSGEGGQRP